MKNDVGGREVGGGGQSGTVNCKIVTNFTLSACSLFLRTWVPLPFFSFLFFDFMITYMGKVIRGMV